MTIEALEPVNRYLGDGVQTAFPIDFPIFGDGRHVGATISTGSGSALVERRLEYGIDYAVTGLTGGGECRTTDPVPAGHTLTLYLDLPIRQPRDFNNQGRLDAEEIEKGLDYLTALTAKHASMLERTVQVPVSDTLKGDDLLSDIFSARDDAQTCRDEACECARLARSEADNARREAINSKIYAKESKDARDETRNMLEMAPGIIGNQYAFFGLSVHNFDLVVEKGVGGEVIDLSQFDYWFVLPDQTRFGIDNNGNLTIKLPITAP
jgi:hypothetical protein